MNECDYCGDEFDHEPDELCSEHDYCVCENCVDACKEQLRLMGELEEENEDELF